MIENTPFLEEIARLLAAEYRRNMLMEMRFRAAVRARAWRRANWTTDEQEDFKLGEGAIKYYD